MDELTLTLQHPLTDEEWDAIVDVDFEYANEITFYTKNGKKVDFVKKPQWIPCSERLPELDDEVLVTDDRGELRHCIFCTWGETWCGFITYEEGMRIKPVAWMPLPSPYQPEEESDED